MVRASEQSDRKGSETRTTPAVASHLFTPCCGSFRPACVRLECVQEHSWTPLWGHAQGAERNGRHRAQPRREPSRQPPLALLRI